MPQADHNDYNNITYNKILLAMVAGNVETVEQLIENMENTYQAMQSNTDKDPDDSLDETADTGVNDDQGPS